MQISRVIIFTPDVDRLAEFYTRCFGLEPISQPNEHWTELRSGTCDLALHNIDEQGPDRDGWIKIVFASADVPAEKARLESLGVKMCEVVTFGSIDLCDGTDPDGNHFQISSRST